MNIWQELKSRGQPILALSPMDGVTNLPMRLITKKYGQPDLVFTEFVNVEGLHFARERLLPILRTLPDLPDGQAGEKPVIAQLYGLNPDYFYEATKLVCKLGFSGIDLNMGCPARTVVSNGAGAGLIKNPDLAKEIFVATRQAAADFATEHGGEVLPVSIKTRLGYEKSEEMPAWLNFLLELSPVAISLHGRTLKQGYSGEADWEKIAEAVKLAAGSQTLILGNGDIENYDQAQERVAQSGVAGVLIGRGALGNPFVFNGQQVTAQELAKIAVEHCELYEKLFFSREKYNFLPMRTHLAAYIRGFPEASKVRSELMQTNSAAEVRAILQKYSLI